MSRITNPIRIAVLSSALIVTGVAAPAITQTAACDGAPWSVFEELVGTYDLVADGQTKGSATVKLVANGCGLTQELTIDGNQVFTTESFKNDGTWATTAVIDDGSVAHTEGKPLVSAGRLTSLELNGTVAQANGTVDPVVSSYRRSEDGQLQQTVKVKVQGNWVEAFSVTYVAAGKGNKERRRKSQSQPKPKPTEASSAPKRQAQPAASTTREEAPTIRISSAESAPVVRGTSKVSRIQVESPMSVELPLGPLDQIPEGYGWRSRDLAQYEIDGGTIEIVEVKKRTKRKNTGLAITFFGRSEAYTSEFELTIQILSADGEPLTESVTQKLYTGRAVGAQATDGVSKTTIDLATDASAFDAAFEDGKRPVLMIKVVALG